MTSDKNDRDSAPGAFPTSLLSRLLQRSKEGDLKAMEDIYEQYKTPLFNLACRYTYDRVTAEDLLQDIFIKIFTHVQEVRTEKTFVAWVYRIAINTCYSYLRGKKSRERSTVALSQIEGKKEEAAYNSHEQSLGKSLDEAISRLPERLRTVFLLHDVQGFKHGEIARLLRISAGTSKSQLFKARIKIRDFLKARQTA